MSLHINNIIEENLLGISYLAAGKQGFYNEITWVNVMEILDTPESVAEGELLVTTGYQLDCEDIFGSLIPQLKKKKVSGMAIQLGYYIHEVPPYLLKQADREGFPILVIPSQRTFSEILHILLQRIQSGFLTDNCSQDMDYFYHAISQDIQLYSDNLFSKESNCVHLLLLLKPVMDSSAHSQKLLPYIQKIRSFLTSESVFCCSHEAESGMMAMLIATEKDASYTTLLYTLNIELTFMSENNDVHFYVGSDLLPEPGCLPLSIKHAQECLDLLHSMHARRGLCHYENIPFLKMMNNLHHNSQSVVLDNQPLQLLLNYDKSNATNYTQTLRIYFAENCNVTRTAKRLFIHRHTLLNRLDKIRDLCYINLEDYYARLYLSIALLFHDYFSF